MEDENTQTTTQPDFWKAAKLIGYDCQELCDFPGQYAQEVVDEAIRRLYNSPEAMQAAGLCRMESAMKMLEGQQSDYEAELRAANEQLITLESWFDDHQLQSPLAEQGGVSKNIETVKELKEQLAQVREKLSSVAEMRDRLFKSLDGAYNILEEYRSIQWDECGDPVGSYSDLMDEAEKDLIEAAAQIVSEKSSMAAEKGKTV